MSDVERGAITVEEFADRYRVCTATVYNLMRRGDLSWITVGNRRRIPVSAIEAFESANARRSTDKAEACADAN